MGIITLGKFRLLGEYETPSGSGAIGLTNN